MDRNTVIVWGNFKKAIAMDSLFKQITHIYSNK